MTSEKSRPVALLLVGWLFILVGCGSLVRGSWTFIASLGDSRAVTPGHNLLDLTLVTISGMAAAAGGILLLRGRGWARWLILAWMGAHVILSLVHSRLELVIHATIFVVLVAVLWNRAVIEYFRGPVTAGGSG